MDATVYDVQFFFIFQMVVVVVVEMVMVEIMVRLITAVSVCFTLVGYYIAIQFIYKLNFCYFKT
jgi:hypothetical protein